MAYKSHHTSLKDFKQWHNKHIASEHSPGVPRYQGPQNIVLWHFLPSKWWNQWHAYLARTAQ